MMDEVTSFIGLVLSHYGIGKYTLKPVCGIDRSCGSVDRERRSGASVGLSSRALKRNERRRGFVSFDASSGDGRCGMARRKTRIARDAYPLSRRRVRVDDYRYDVYLHTRVGSGGARPRLNLLLFLMKRATHP